MNKKLFLMFFSVFFALFFSIISVNSIRAANTFIFNNNLQIGIISPDVKELQKFFNANGYILTKYGAGSIGKETNYFGSITRSTLIKFQKDNKITPAAGYFGPVTREIVNKKISDLVANLPSKTTTTTNSTVCDTGVLFNSKTGLPCVIAASPINSSISDSGVVSSSTSDVSPTPFTPTSTPQVHLTKEQALKALGISSVDDFGAKGDGITDDSAAFRSAIAASQMVYLSGLKTYKIAERINIGHAVTIFSDGTSVIDFSGTGGFYIHSSNVGFENFKLSGENETSGSCALTIDNTFGVFDALLKVRNISANNLSCVLGDVNANWANGNGYYDVFVDNITVSNPRGTQFRLRGSQGLIYLRNITMSGGSAMSNDPYILISDAAGALLSNIMINGNSTGLNQHGISLPGSVAIWLDDIIVNNVGGWGIFADTAKYIYMKNLTTAGNAEGGIRLDNSEVILGDALNMSGNHTGLSLDNDVDVYLSDSSISDSVSSGVLLSGGSKMDLAWIRSNDNKGYGIESSSTAVTLYGYTGQGNALGEKSTDQSALFYSEPQQPISLAPVPTALYKADTFEPLGTLISSPESFVSVTNYGAKGDGATDNTAAFQKAVDSGKNVYVPESLSGYAMRGRVIISKSISIVAPRNTLLISAIPTGSTGVFLVNSSGVRISGFTMSNSTNVGAAIVLNASTMSLSDLVFSDLDMIGFAQGISNEGLSTNPVLDIAFQHVVGRNLGGPTINITNGNRISLSRVFPVRQGNVVSTYNNLLFTNIQNLFIDESSGMGYGNDVPSPYSTPLAIYKSTNVWIRNFEGDSSNGHGTWIGQSSNVNLSGYVGSLNALSQIVFASDQAVRSINMYLSGPAGTGRGLQSTGPGFFSLSDGTFLNLFSKDNSAISTGDGKSTIVYQNSWIR